jgi:hypothetical protein
MGREARTPGRRSVSCRQEEEANEMDADTEALMVVEDTARFEETVAAARRSVRLTQVLPPRLALAVVPGGRLPPTKDTPAADWYADEVPDGVLARLAPGERLFVAAWLERRRGKERPSDHLPWDSLGHLPPDWKEGQ